MSPLKLFKLFLKCFLTIKSHGKKMSERNLIYALAIYLLIFCEYIYIVNVISNSNK